jgi:hypothetical protein
MKWKIVSVMALGGLMLAGEAAAQTPSGGTGPGASPSQPGTSVSPSSPTIPGGAGPLNLPTPSTGAADPTRPGSSSTPGTNVPGRGRDLGLPCPAGQARPTGSSMCTPAPPGSPVPPPTTR